MSDAPSVSARPSTAEWLRRAAVALGSAAVLLFFFSPSWGAFVLWARVPEMGGMLEVRRGVSVIAQMAHPGAAVADPLHAAIQWRLLFPALGHLLSLPPAALFSLADVGCLATLFYLVVLLRRRGLGWLDTGLAAVALGAASWFFASTGWLGYYDSWFALALLIVPFAESEWSVWVACVWAPWIDERFALAAPLALACRWLWLTEAARADLAAPRFAWKRTLLPPAVLLALFVAVRLGVLAGETASGATAAGYLAKRDYLAAPLGRILLGVWEGLRAGWIFAGVGVALIGWGGGVVRRPSLALALAGVVVALAGIGLATAQDYDRSMTLLLPVAVLGVLLAVRRGWTPLPRVLRGAALLTLLLPAHHVMSDRVNPIFYLYHELAALHTPPPGAMPEVYELHAIHEMERGEFESADRDLTLAIKLSANPASPARQRGILTASQGHWDAALEDFTTAVTYDPQNPDAWLMRAQANFALGHVTQARSDLDRALALAPDGWAKRPDVARFLAKLNRAP